MNGSESSSFDQAKADAFLEKMVGVVNGGALALMTSLGHRTGLFDAMSQLDHGTCEEIAKRSELNERYVREWLGAMVTGNVVEYDPKTEKFRLPPEHAALLTRASDSNFGITTQFIGVLGQVETAIADRFRSGGGIGYECFDRFHEVMAEESGQTVVAALHDHILPLIADIDSRLQSGIEVLDVGCGSGRAICDMARTYPASRFRGFDLCHETVMAGNQRAREDGLTNVEFEQRDVTDLGSDRTYGLVCAFDAIHDQADPEKVLEEIHRVLEDDGVFLMQDIAGSSHLENNLDHPIAPFMYTISCMHCMTVSLAQNGAGLGAMWGKELACRMLADAGFAETRVEQLEHDIINYYYISRKR